MANKTAMDLLPNPLPDGIRGDWMLFAAMHHDAVSECVERACEKSPPTKCERCGGPFGARHEPPGGWELENGEIVCHQCCVVDTIMIGDMLNMLAKKEIKEIVDGN